MTIPSPCSMGMTDTRTSTSRPCDLQLDAAVLRQPLLGDVQPGHDLQAADDRGLEAIDLRRRGLRLQQAVDAVANLHARGLRLDVDVAGPRVDRFEQNLVHQVNDRRLLHLGGDLAVLDLQAVDQLDLFLLALGEQAFDRLAADAEVGLDPLGDRLARGEHRDDRAAQGRGRFVERVEIERIGGGDDARRRGARSTGNRPWRWISLGGNGCSSDRSTVGAFQVDEVDARFRAQGPQGVGLAHQAQVARPIWSTRSPLVRASAARARSASVSSPCFRRIWPASIGSRAGWAPAAGTAQQCKVVGGRRGRCASDLPAGGEPLSTLDGLDRRCSAGSSVHLDYERTARLHRKWAPYVFNPCGGSDVSTSATSRSFGVADGSARRELVAFW